MTVVEVLSYKALSRVDLLYTLGRLFTQNLPFLADLSIYDFFLNIHVFFSLNISKEVFSLFGIILKLSV